MDARDRSRRRLPALGAILGVAILCWATAGVALAQSPFSPLPAQPSTAPTPVVTTPSTSATGTSGGGLSSSEQLGLIGAGILLIAGIAFLIRRDARARAPVTGRGPGSGQRGSARPRAKRVEQNRARAKRARQARKRAR